MSLRPEASCPLRFAGLPYPEKLIEQSMVKQLLNKKINHLLGVLVNYLTSNMLQTFNTVSQSCVIIIKEMQMVRHLFIGKITKSLLIFVVRVYTEMSLFMQKGLNQEIFIF